MSSEILDISSNCFVFASAGTGKTKNLVDRFIKLILSEISPDKVLCLTFTKIAAYEMKERIISMLEKFVIDPEFAKNYFTNTLNIPFSYENLLKTYDKFIESIPYLQIQTVHSFCKKILQTFPIEAGVLPGFEIITEEDSADFINIAKDEVLREIFLHSPKILKTLLNFVSETSFENMVEGIYQSSSKIRRFFLKNKDLYKYEQILKKIFNLEENIEIPQYLVTKTAEQLKISIETSEEEWRNILLTKKDSVRKNIESKGNYALQLAILILKKIENKKKLRTIENTINFLKIIEKIINKYDNFKKEHSFLDFSDVIQKVELLFTKNEYKSLIDYYIYKYISHFMCDEAQDLSIDQWNLVSNITSRIVTDTQNNKTIFIVGDIKQSIYGFQESDPLYFLRFYKKCTELSNQHNKKIYTVNLDKNYRSSPKILSMVDKVFSGEIGNYAFEKSPYKTHTAFHQSLEGKLEIHNLEHEDLIEISNEISEFVKIVTATDCNEDDIMILTRNRSTLSDELRKSFLKKKMNILSDNRILFRDEIIIKDIISIASISLGDYDDYNTVCILKSQFFLKTPLTEEDIFYLCRNEKRPIYDIILNSNCEKLTQMKEILKNCTEFAKIHTVFDFFYLLSKEYIMETDQNSHIVLSEFLLYVLNFQNQKSEKLSEFINYFKEHNSSIKNSNTNGGRIQTIHSSKGTESKTVFLLDFALKADSKKTKFIWGEDLDHDIFFIKPSLNDSFPEIEPMIKSQLEKEEKELLRLLYVALTRAKQNIYIIGPLSKNGCFELIKHSLLQ